MSDFARLQGDFQRAILEGDDGILAEILDSDKEKREALFSVYRNAYVLRLVEVLRTENEFLHTYLGDEAFDAMARDYVAARPSRHPNLRWYSRGIPDFLATYAPLADDPAATELSRLETALSDAFDVQDGPVLALEDFGGVAPDAWPHLIFTPHESARRLDLATNAWEIWAALREEEAPPKVVQRDETERLIVWRQDFTPMVRPMAAEEAMMWDEASDGIPFEVLCEMVATFDDPESAAARAAGYLQGWVGAGLLGGLRIGGHEPDQDR